MANALLARQQDLEADFREEGQPNRQQVLEPVHQQPHGVDGEDLLPRKAQPQLAGPSGRAGAALSQRPRRWERAAPPRTALRPRRPQMRSDSSEVMARIGLS